MTGTMKHFFALLVGMSVATGAAWSQSDTTTDSEAVTTTESEAATTEGDPADTSISGLSTGVVEGQIQVGQTYRREEFNAWELRCVKTESGRDPCQLYQLLKDSEGNSVAEFNMFPLPDGQQAAAGANVITPLETLLTANLRMAVDSGQTKVYPYSFCSQIGCFARIGLTADEIAGFRKGAAAKIMIVPAAAPEDTVELTLSLSGFTAGYNALVEADKAARAEQ